MRLMQLTNLALVLQCCAIAAVSSGRVSRKYSNKTSTCPAGTLDLANQVATGENDSTAHRQSRARLPTHLTPVSYHVQILPFIEPSNFTFFGHVRIHLKCLSPATNITLHSRRLNIEPRSIDVQDRNTSDSLSVSAYQYDPIGQYFVLLLEQSLQPQHIYQVSLNYTGYLNSEMHGFYRSKYTDEQGVTRWLAVTQLESTDARKVFPCLDEPALKAVFNVTLGRKSSMRAASNTPLKHTRAIESVPGYYWDTFEPTLPMSTYLLAFLVSDFDVSELRSNTSSVQFRLWARSSVIEQGNYSLTIVPKILAHFERYFRTPFPLPKIDLAAIPDFSAGAMENWGLITFRETMLLYDSEHSSLLDKQKVAYTVAHELAHQWFGNLVTPSWWSDLWLNEGFATYLQYVGVDFVEPGWRFMDTFITETFQSVMEMDSLRASHQISIPIEWPDEVDEIFDHISYEKGAVIVRMMEHFLTKHTLSKALAKYIQKFKYRSAEQNDLWRTLTEQAHSDKTLSLSQTVEAIMNSWTLQTGFPLVTVTYDRNNNSVHLKQQRFLFSDTNHVCDTSSWNIPITYTDMSAANFRDTTTNVWLTSQYMTVENVSVAASDWLLFNVQSVGFYKVHYDDNNWRFLVDQLLIDHNQIPGTNRAQLIDDLFDLSRSGHTNYRLLFRMLPYLEQELDYLPWEATLANLDYIRKQMSTFDRQQEHHSSKRKHHPHQHQQQRVHHSNQQQQQNYEIFRQFGLRLITKHYNRIGFVSSLGDNSSNTGQDHTSRLHRHSIVDWACRLGQPECLTHSSQLYAQWMQQQSNNSSSSSTIIPEDIRDVVLCTAIRTGSDDEWFFVVAHYRQSTSARERLKLLQAMGCTERPHLVDRYLQALIRPHSWIRDQDVAIVFSALTQSVRGLEQAWPFLCRHWSTLQHHRALDSMNARHTLAAFSHHLGTEERLSQLLTLLAQYDNRRVAANRQLLQLIEEADNDISWRSRNYNTVLNNMARYIENYDRRETHKTTMNKRYK